MSRNVTIRQICAVLPLFVLATCTAPPPPAVAPPPPAPMIVPAAPPVSDDWRDWPPSAGAWVYRGGTAGGAAFGVAGRAPEIALRCEGGTIVIARAAAPLASARTIAITTSDAVRSFAGVDRGGFAVVSLAARDPFLDAMAFSRGRIVVAVAGTPRLVLPAWAEIGRVVEDCRG